MSSLEPYRHRPAERSAARDQILAERRLAVQRTHDRGRAELAAARASDLSRVTRHAVNAAALIAIETEMAVQMVPWAQQDLIRVGRAGMAGIAGVIADLADPFA